MGEISPKLEKVLGMVKDEATIPVIVKLTEFGAEPINTLEGMGMKVDEQFRMTKMVSGSIRAGDVQSLAELPVVETVHYDEPLTVEKVPFFRIAERDSGLIPVSDSYTVGALGAPQVWQQYGYEGKGVKVAVLDTGASHPMFEENVVDTFSVVPGETVNEGNHSHGSWCQGCVAGTPYTGVLEGQTFDLVGMAPSASLITGKVLSDDGSGKTSWVLKGMEKAYDLGADIISMSLGSPVSQAGHSPDSQMVDELAKEGVLCSVASGNQYVNGSIGSPGDAKGALTVASVSYTIPTRDVVSTFSSKGPTIDLRLKPDIAAFGGNVIPEMNELLVCAGKNGELDSMAGTSMATPHNSGALALLVQAGMPTKVDTAEYSLGQTAKRLNPIPKDVNRGWGQLNVFDAVEKAWWESPSNQTFSQFTEFSNEATYPFRAVATPITKKAIQMLGVETTPKLAVISQTVG